MRRSAAWPQFATEFDYRGECKNAIEIRENLKRAGYSSIIVPEVYPELCTEKLMVMEEIRPSTPLHNALDEQAAMFAKQKGITKKEFVDSEQARVGAEALALAKEGKVMKSVSAMDYDRYIALQRLKKFACAWTVGWFAKVSDADVIVPLNAAKLIDDLLAVHGHEILIDGVFNAGTHLHASAQKPAFGALLCCLETPEDALTLSIAPAAQTRTRATFCARMESSLSSTTAR